ncbi:MAG: hypothetical protein P0Y52_14015 [Candidatus Brevundimonas phytovorans]|nr:hypothetical protein [Brevundimonas sp.]WEK57639.1 MAG: hypothetical protein P0Y52_14015 [Brevundimonas sp.]
MKVLKLLAGAMTLTVAALLVLIFAYVTWMPRGPALTAVAPTPHGKGSFVMSAWKNSDRRTIRVWTYRPDAWSPEDPVLFVMHGMGRNAETYLDRWSEIADRKGILLIAPEFDSRFAEYITSDYQEGNLRNVFGAPNPESEWAFTAIENVVDHINAANDWSVTQYDMFGHSAGGQFVQRMVMVKPEARIRRAIAANAGTYAFPDSSIDFPYGVKGVSNDRGKSYARHLIILLGENDTDAEQGRLDQSARAMDQGDHRLERGMKFYAAAQADAEQRGLPFNWQVSTVPDVGHDFRRMSEAAGELF